MVGAKSGEVAVGSRLHVGAKVIFIGYCEIECKIFVCLVNHRRQGKVGSRAADTAAATHPRAQRNTG